MNAIIKTTNNYKRVILAVILSLTWMVPAYAEVSLANLLNSQQGTAILIIMMLTALVVILMGFTLYMLAQLKSIIFEKEGLKAEKKETAWDRFYVKYIAGRHVAIGRESEKLMDHEYDGIREMDHPMPPWLKYVFIGTVVFGVYYMAAYLVFDTGVSQFDEYADQMEEARLLAAERMGDKEPITAETVALDQSSTTLMAGKQLYDMNCAACHAKDGGGTIGPNLTDEYWIHGGSISDIFRVIYEGVPEKGMIPWNTQLSPQQIQNVTNYVLTLQDVEPANPKAPEGEKYVPPAVEEEEAPDNEDEEAVKEEMAAL